MDILKSEILRKRQLVEDRNLLVENKKYFKRSELAKKEEEAYFERCGYKPISEKPSGEVQPKEDDQKPLTSSNPVLELELAEEKLPMTLSRQEVIRRLRERGEPMRLFGETDYDAFQRLRKIEILTPEVNKFGQALDRTRIVWHGFGRGRLRQVHVAQAALELNHLVLFPLPSTAVATGLKE
ncbi:pre-mRNA-splicing factor 18 isoform X7 [Rattus norvegicus]|uniref:pre-mRNA-splicing factor 18 isoform X7 n=1 Tax=Rattus norvegicus TaxID=10116 RepID=UPI00191708A4|nr:pre-mRNA-splicing factor 18 isoform X6 [Rattus norvegicus]